MPSSKSAAIVGGSIAGLFAALLLTRAGWDVRVYERSPGALSGRGAGIVTHPELLDLLHAAGADPPRAFGVLVRSRVVLDRDGAILASRDREQLMTAWDRLWRLLRDTLPEGAYVPGAELTAFTQEEAAVRLHFEGGSEVEADLLVGADGIRSTVRRALFGEIAPDYAGYVAWRGLVDEAAVDPALFPLFAFCLPPGEQALGYPVAGRDDTLEPGQRRYNWVWYRPADPAQLRALLTDAAGRRHVSSIPPPLIRANFIAALRARARATLAPSLAEVIVATPRPLLQPIYDLAASRLAVGRVALIGDAAFVARPHVGAGATKAAQDAVSLVRALADLDIPDALRRYEAERLPAGQRFLRRARHLGGFLQARPDLAGADHATPEAVLEETAILSF